MANDRKDMELGRSLKRHLKGDLINNEPDPVEPGENAKEIDVSPSWGKWRGRGITNWRDWMRKHTKNGAEIHEILLEIARGKPKVVTLLDGKQTTIVPTADVRARVAIHLDEMLHGKAVTQNEQQRAEREAGALAAVQAMSDEALADRARAVLLRNPGGILEEGEIIEPLARRIQAADVSLLDDE
jgi:hypothetical protein